VIAMPKQQLGRSSRAVVRVGSSALGVMTGDRFAYLLRDSLRAVRGVVVRGAGSYDQRS
jgi:hypothetical protein